MNEVPRVGLVMGSNSDWDVMQHAAAMLEKFGIAFEARVVSAHRTPDLLFDYAVHTCPACWPPKAPCRFSGYRYHPAT